MFTFYYIKVHDLMVWEFFNFFFFKKKKSSLSMSLCMLTNMLEKYHIFHVNIWRVWVGSWQLLKLNLPPNPTHHSNSWICSICLKINIISRNGGVAHFSLLFLRNDIFVNFGIDFNLHFLFAIFYLIFYILFLFSPNHWSSLSNNTC